MSELDYGQMVEVMVRADLAAEGRLLSDVPFDELKRRAREALSDLMVAEAVEVGDGSVE